MSSDIVRDTFRQALTDFFPDVEYVESIATRVNNLELSPLWHSLQFIPESDNPISLGNPACWREQGIVRVWIGAIAGKGDDIAINHADDVNTIFRRFSAGNGNIRVMSSMPPQNNPESDGRWFLVAVDLRYQYDRVV